MSEVKDYVRRCVQRIAPEDQEVVAETLSALPPEEQILGANHLNHHLRRRHRGSASLFLKLVATLSRPPA